MSGILNVTERPLYDESITKKEYHTYLPYLQSYGNNDEIRISIQNQDLYVLLSESLLCIDGAVTKINDNKRVVPTDMTFKNNCAAHLFNEIRYELNGNEVDRTRFLGHATTIKNLVSLSPTESSMMRNAGWSLDENIAHANSHFSFCVPLKALLGFAEDFEKILINSKHELILIRTKADENLFYKPNGEIIELKILKISWKVPHIQIADAVKLQTYKIVKSGTPLPIVFRSWDCHFNPGLPESTNHSWIVKMAPQNERPRFALIAFEHNGQFTDSSITDLKVHLNSETYPYDDLNLNLARNHISLLYDMYAKFQKSFYLREPQPLLNCTEFKKYPIFVIDLSHQNEQVKTGPIDIRIEFKTLANIKPKTSAHCVLIHDRVLTYSPLTGQIEKH